MPVLFVKVSEHAGTSKYGGKSIGALQLFSGNYYRTVTLGTKYYSIPHIMVV